MYPGIRKYEKKVKTVFNVSGALQVLNKVYHKRYKLVDLSDAIGVSPDTLSRLSEGSQFCIVYKVASWTSCISYLTIKIQAIRAPTLRGGEGVAETSEA